VPDYPIKEQPHGANSKLSDGRGKRGFTGPPPMNASDFPEINLGVKSWDSGQSAIAA